MWGNNLLNMGGKTGMGVALKHTAEGEEYSDSEDRFDTLLIG